MFIVLLKFSDNKGNAGQFMEAGLSDAASAVCRAGTIPKLSLTLRGTGAAAQAARPDQNENTIWVAVAESSTPQLDRCALGLRFAQPQPPQRGPSHPVATKSEPRRHMVAGAQRRQTRFSSYAGRLGLRFAQPQPPQRGPRPGISGPRRGSPCRFGPDRAGGAVAGRDGPRSPRA